MSLLEILSLILEYLKVLLSAPVVAGAIAIVCLCLFRGEVRGLIERVGRIRFPGGELFASQQERTQADIAPKEQPPAVPQGQQPQLPATITLAPQQAPADWSSAPVGTRERVSMGVPLPKPLPCPLDATRARLARHAPTTDFRQPPRLSLAGLHRRRSRASRDSNGSPKSPPHPHPKQPCSDHTKRERVPAMARPSACRTDRLT